MPLPVVLTQALRTPHHLPARNVDLHAPNFIRAWLLQGSALNSGTLKLSSEAPAWPPTGLFFFFHLLALPHDMWDLSSLTPAPYIGNVKSESLHHQRSPPMGFCWEWKCQLRDSQKRTLRVPLFEGPSQAFFPLHTTLTPNM